VEKVRPDSRRTGENFPGSLIVVSKWVDPCRHGRQGGVVYRSNENDDARFCQRKERTRVETRGGSAIMDDTNLFVGSRVALIPSVSLSQ
jgi:hypothetical protein